MERLLAVQADGGKLATPVAPRHPVIDTWLGPVPVVTVYEQYDHSPLDAFSIDDSRDAGTAVAYDRRLVGRTLSCEELGGNVVDRHTGSVWDLPAPALTGSLHGGPCDCSFRTRSSGSRFPLRLPGTEILPAPRRASCRDRRRSASDDRIGDGAR
jgi:hypothetical protein